MAQTIETRRAVLSDAQVIANIHRSARAKAMPWLPVIYTPEEELAFFSSRLRADEMFRVAIVDGEMTGFIAIEGQWINHLYVHPEHWRKGSGARLLSEAKGFTPHLQLWAFRDNALARAFYLHHGFEEVEFTDGARNEERMPDVRMSWSQ